MTFKEIMRDLENRIYKPIYLLMGDEPYYIDLISNYIAEHVLTEAEKSFNMTVQYGKDTDVYALDQNSRRFPMMASHQVVILKEAQDLKKIEELVHYASKPSKSTILVLNYKYKSLPKNRKLYKAIAKNGVAFESKKLYESAIPKWVTEFLANKNYRIMHDANALLTESLGTDLSKIANELDKLIIRLPKGVQEITATHIEENIGISKDFNNFELQKALSKKNVLKANRIINYFAENQKSNHIITTITSLYFYFSKLLVFHYLPNKSNKFAVASALKINPYFVGDYTAAAKAYPHQKVVQIISILREYDVKSKGVNNVSATAGDLLKEMIFRILH